MLRAVANSKDSELREVPRLPDRRQEGTADSARGG